MIEFAAGLEATDLAQFLKRSRWVYPLVNAGHILGIALLVGSVVPMDLRLAGVARRPALAGTLALLRPTAAAGFALAACCGVLLFLTQATDYIVNGWFRIKLLLIALALANVAVHLRLVDAASGTRKRAAILSLALWPAVLICGRMIGYS